MTKETETKWAERIREWRASGLSAEEFATSKEYRASTLQWMASQLRDAAAAPEGPTAKAGRTRSRPSVRRRAPARSGTPRFLPMRLRNAPLVMGAMVVEIGGAQVRVSRGFDAMLLADVVRALVGCAR
jgi:hypothetical protein